MKRFLLFFSTALTTMALSAANAFCATKDIAETAAPADQPPTLWIALACGAVTLAVIITVIYLAKKNKKD